MEYNTKYKAASSSFLFGERIFAKLTKNCLCKVVSISFKHSHFCRKRQLVPLLSGDWRQLVRQTLEAMKQLLSRCGYVPGRGWRLPSRGRAACRWRPCPRWRGRCRARGPSARTSTASTCPRRARGPRPGAGRGSGGSPPPARPRRPPPPSAAAARTSPRCGRCRAA